MSKTPFHAFFLTVFVTLWVELQALFRLPFGADTAARPVITIPLDKQYVPVKRNNRTVMHKTAYFGNVFVGLPKPQNFSVVFDTGSGHVFVPSSKCNSAPCKSHRRFDRALSASAIDLDHSGATISPSEADRDEVVVEYGTGQMLGEFSREVMCLTNHAGSNMDAALQNPDCVQLRVIFATELSQEPFQSFRFDGVLGLGLAALAVDPEFSFFGQIAKLNKRMTPLFGVFISRSDHIPSEITFGGHNPRRVSSALHWAPVFQPEQGHWQLRILSVKIGGQPVDVCETGDCSAIVDTGTSLLGVPKLAAQHVHWLLARKVPENPEEMDCRTHPGPNITFDFGSVELMLGSEDYSRPAGLRVVNRTTNESQFICRASLLPVDENTAMNPKTWILGEPVLRRYYAAFDWDNKMMGFSPSVQPRVASEETAHHVFGAPESEKLTPTVVFS